MPELFSYLQELVDTNPATAQYILTGSSQFLLMENISQSLAGRIITFHLYPLLGYIFETFIIAECFKRFANFGEQPPLYFWRDQSKNEIDLLIQTGTQGYPIEIKLAQTYHPDFQKTIQRWLELENNQATKGCVIFCGEHALNIQSSVPAIPWYNY